MRVQDPSPRWNSQRLAAIEAVETNVNRVLAIVYAICVASAVVYMVGWLRFSLFDLPDGPLPAFTICAVILTAFAGVLHAAMLPAVAVSLGLQRLLARLMKQRR